MSLLGDGADKYFCRGVQDDFDTRRRPGGGSTLDMPLALINLLGAKFRIAKGYTVAKTLTHAVEQGEVHRRCGYEWDSLRATKPG